VQAVLGPPVLHSLRHSPYMLDYSMALIRGAHLPSVVDQPADLQVSEAPPEAGWDILQHLGHRPAALVIPNGVIWVEGPSDVIYVRTWLDQVREGEQGQFGGVLMQRSSGTVAPSSLVLTAEDRPVLVLCTQTKTSRS